MTALPTRTRRKKRFKCHSCRFVATGPTKLHQHYAQHPNHRVKTPRKRETVSRSPIHFCPYCGHGLRGLL